MKKLIPVLLLASLPVVSFAQEGAPLLTHFREERDIENQSRAICQDIDKMMLFANRKGILTFDGEEWTSVRTPVTPFALEKNLSDGRIYASGEDDFGFLDKDSFGAYKYLSLNTDTVLPGDLDRIISGDSLVCFWGDYSVICYNTVRHKITRFMARLGERYTGVVLKGGKVFINVEGSGLFRVESDTLFPIVTGPVTKDSELLFTLPYDERRVLIGFSDGRFSLFDGIKFSGFSFNDGGYIEQNVLSGGIAIGDSLYAFSTLGGGAVVADRKTAKIIHIINNQKGLPDDEVVAIGSDASGGLWISHAMGISRAELRLPLDNFSIYPGLAGNLSSVVRYKGELYVSTSEGVYYLTHERRYSEVEVLRKIEERPAQASSARKEMAAQPLMPPVQQEAPKKSLIGRIFGKKPQSEQTPAAAASTPVISDAVVPLREVPVLRYRTEKLRKLKSIDYVYKKVTGMSEKCRQLVPTDQGILAATNRGLYVIIDHRALPVVEDRYINFIGWTPFNGIFPVAADDGYFLISPEKGRWRVTEPDNSFTEPVYSATFTSRDTLWFSGDNYAMMAVLGYGEIPKEYKKFTLQNSFTQRYLVRQINDTLFLLTESGVSTWDRSAGRFTPHRDRRLLPEGQDVLQYPVSNLPLIISGDEWIYPEMNRKTGEKALSLLKVFDNVRSVISEGSNFWIIDGENRLFAINTSKISVISPEPGLMVRYIRNEEGKSFSLSDIVFERGDNIIRFNIVAPAYLEKNLTRYQYFIEGVMDDWSPWSHQGSYSKAIPNPGEYVLQVRAMDLWGKIGEPVQIRFTMKAPLTQTTLFYFASILFVLVVVFIIIRFRERQLQEKNRILEEKVKERTAEIEAQKEEITSSIEYASRIQLAMMPVPELFREAFTDYFILFKPRDIVSGDFYWVGEDQNHIFLTVADCTGHGVPGAFMSTLGISILNEILTHNDNLQANLFLNLLRSQIKRLLHQTGKEGEASDGMDISLVAIRKDRKKLQFAGAYNPLYLCSGGDLKEYKADRMPIGIHYGDESSFTNYEINVQKGDVIYLLSDGLTDQFGGPEGSKFKKAQLKKLLAEIHGKPLSEQKAAIEAEFQRWKGRNEQVDDITIIGVRI